jgi:hypothetical protein
MHLHESRMVRWARSTELAWPTGVALLALGSFGILGGARMWIHLNDREPILAGLPAGGARQHEVPPRTVGRVVLIIADGLNADLIHGMGSLVQLEGRGVRAEARAPGPTFTFPSYVTWLAALDPVDSGVRTNRYRGPFPLDSLLARARAGGLRTFGYDEARVAPLAKLFGPHLETYRDRSASWPQIAETVRRSDVSVLSLVAVDEAGHAFGPESSEHSRAVRRVDRQIQEVASWLDLSVDLCVVVNDHGHVAGGGHGGLEDPARRLFLVAAGAGIARRADPGPMDQKDLAPTLALLLGLPPPAHNRGWSLGWALGPEPFEGFAEMAFAAQYQTRHRTETFLLGQLGAAADAGPAPTRDLRHATLGSLADARRIGWRTLRDLQHQVDRAQRGKLLRLRLERLLGVGAALLFSGMLLVGAGRAGLLHLGWSGAGAALAILGLTLGALALAGVGPTLSHGGTPARWLLRIAAASGGAGVVGLMVPSWLKGRDPPDRFVGTILTVAWVQGLAAGGAYVLIPVSSGAALPDLRLLAGSLVAGTCFVVYLLLLGSAALLVGCRRRWVTRAVAPADGPGVNVECGLEDANDATQDRSPDPRG